MLTIQDIDNELLEESAILCMLKAADRGSAAQRATLKKIDEWLDMRLVLMEMENPNAMHQRV